MARLFTCADVLEQLEDSNGDVSSGDDSAYEGEGYLPKATSFMPDAEDMHDMDLDASTMDQERAHCVTLASSIV